MVYDYYQLKEPPFNNSADTRYLYLSPGHREALASLLYGVQSGCGFIALVAKPGMGKTTLLLQALEQLRDKATTVFIFQTMCTPVEFLRALLADLGVQENQGTLFELQSKLNEFLVEQARSGKPLILVIDEAQNLDDSVLEVVRMLSNFQISTGKFLQIILSGQPQLAEKLATPKLVQLRQRISILARLKPFSQDETALYVEHRLWKAGYKRGLSLFTCPALELIAQYSGGIPRNINNICFNALSVGCALKRKVIDCDIIREVIADLDLEPLQESVSPPPPVKPQGLPEAPAAVANSQAVSRPSNWVSKVAVVCATLSLLLGVLWQAHRRTLAVNAARADIVVQPVVPAMPVPAISPAIGQISRPVSATVLVRPGQTLSSICVQRFGSCNPELVHQILRLNPSLVNPDFIKDSQSLRIPLVQERSEATESTSDQADKSSFARRGTQ
jgi:general secretion pathway protein A